MSARINARFYVSKFEKQVVGSSDGQPRLQGFVTLNAVTRKDTEDNVDWAKYSPAGQMTLSVSQEAGGAFAIFEHLLGKDVSIVMTEIETD